MPYVNPNIIPGSGFWKMHGVRIPIGRRQFLYNRDLRHVWPPTRNKLRERTDRNITTARFFGTILITGETDGHKAVLRLTAHSAARHVVAEPIKSSKRCGVAELCADQVAVRPCRSISSAFYRSTSGTSVLLRKRDIKAFPSDNQQYLCKNISRIYFWTFSSLSRPRDHERKRVNLLEMTTLLCE